MKRISPVCVLALWSALNSQSMLAAGQAAPSSVKRSQYVGEPMSLSVQNLDVRTVLQSLADFTGFNLMVSDTVKGSITLSLQDVPWDQALELVLESKGLGKRLEGNVLLIAPLEEIAARERPEPAPLRRELVQVNYARAADIVMLFQSVTGGQPGIEGQGTITVDERTNTIIAYESSERLEELRRIVAQLDVPVRQVMIEAWIVEAGVDFEKSLGVRWGGALNNGGLWKAGGITQPAASGAAPGNVSAPFVDLGVSRNTSGLGIA
ncbi:MAG: secretin and TonB N-terminal domain-containing protein, partial [Pseudomonas sp.]|nr:secretin and TonB N-terminal domain-containing protein [Pseudomonas sp.]